jgi:hypothetical protein
VPPLDEKPAAGQKLTLRQKVEEHRKNPSCASCHARIDPLGFALENFDVIGRWRDNEEGSPIDSSGVLLTGESFKGPQGLRDVLLDRREEFVRGAVERLLTYALGRELDARDQPTVRGIMRATATDDYRFHDLVTAVVESVPFRMRQTQE